MKKIMIDMDDVICGGGMLTIVNNFLESNYTETEIKDYYIQDLIPEERKKEWCEYFKENNFYKFAKLNENAVDVLQKLNQKYEIYIGTAYIFKDFLLYSGQNLKNKFEYLQEKLPFIKAEQYVFFTNKEILNCEIKIDDKISNLKGNCEMKLLFTAYHNIDVEKEVLEKEGLIRVDGWNDIKNILL